MPAHKVNVGSGANVEDMGDADPGGVEIISVGVDDNGGEEDAGWAVVAIGAMYVGERSTTNPIEETGLIAEKKG